ncbi:AAA family ATPase [Arachidicoccus sp.]|uniref:AAA family ATPase n=1 Tax=Arachidicoccus sp. TaxID=1872624 RepID=UPI003D211671
MAFKRNIEDYLHRWKSNASRKPLIIRGARQVGKTTLIRNFARSYTYAIVLNLVKLTKQVLYCLIRNLINSVSATIKNREIYSLKSFSYL